MDMILSRRCGGEWWEFIIALAMVMGISFIEDNFSRGFAEGRGGGLYLVLTDMK